MFESIVPYLGYGLLLCMLLLAGLSFLGLPSTWLILGLAGLWHWLYPLPTDMGWSFWLLAVVIALAGEFFEATVQTVIARRFGAKESSLFSDILETLTGSLLITSILQEVRQKRSLKDTGRAVAGTMLGRALCLSIRCGVGVVLLVTSAFYIWPHEAEKAASAIATFLV